MTEQRVETREARGELNSSSPSSASSFSAPSDSRLSPLSRLRLQLSAWYVGTFALILLVLGGALFAVIAHRMASQLGDSLRAAARAVEQAAEIREVEAVSAPGQAVDAVAELTIPDRSLYLFDAAGTPLVPNTADAPVRAIATRSAQLRDTIETHFRPKGAKGGTLEVYAEPFRVVTSGRRYVAVAAADRVELEDQYAALIVAFASAAVGALVLVAAGGWFLSGKATEPVRRTMAHMRRFMADAAHELRTPVAVLRTRADVALQRERDPAAYVTALTAVGCEAERIGGIVDDLLILARADAGERPIAREAVYLDDLALEAVSGVRVLAERRGVELAVREFDEAAVVGDPVLLRQLLVIVLDNAIKFTPAGGSVALEVRAESGRATVTVADTGAGIPPAELPRIFDRFYRGESARAHADGAGLGLSIARWIADAHRADIDVTSTPTVGTRVTIRFPRAPV